MDDKNYDRLGMQVGDIIKSNNVEYKSQEKWVLSNMLPTKLDLWTKKEFTRKYKFLTTIKPRETLKFHSNKFSDNEELYIYCIHNNNSIPFMEPFHMRDLHKDIKIGAVTYTSTSGRGEFQSNHSDLRGIWINNKMAFPLDIYYKNKLSCQVSGYKGLGYMGGGGSSIYFDNDRNGLNLMDKISFRYSIPGPQGKYLFDITLDDQQCNEIFVGVISGSTKGSYTDNAVYNVDKPNYIGIGYYVQTGDYQSKLTN
jgi:hypothetical protein